MCPAVPPSSVSVPRGKKTRRRGKPRSTRTKSEFSARHAADPKNGSPVPRLNALRDPPLNGSPVCAPSLVCQAGTGDHAAIGQFLSVVFPGYSTEQFLATLDDPSCEPPDRLLVRRNSRILSQLRLTHREMMFGDRRLPVAGLFQVATLPEYRGRGYAGRLLDAAGRQMADDGAVMGLLSTNIPHFFRPAGWAVCGRHSHLRVGARALLAQLSIMGGAKKRDNPVSVRPWRQVELPALMRLYAQHTRGAVGPYARSEAYWRWLLAREDYDQIYVAIQGPDKLDLEQYDQDGSQSPLVGYAVTKDDRILELITSAGNRRAAEGLLARSAHEAIERDHHGISLHAMPHDPLGQWIRKAGGVRHNHESHQGEVLMVKLLDPIAFLESLCPLLHQRANTSRLSRPCELGLLVEGEKYRLVLSRRSVRVKSKKVGRSYLSCNWAEFTRLVMGHTDLSKATASGRLEASTRVALETARALFPQLPLWRPPWDDQLP